MTSPVAFARADFDRLLGEHQQLLGLTNELEYRLYQLGEVPAGGPAAACRQAAAAVVGFLRDFLFRQDQQVLPVPDALTRERGTLDDPSHEPDNTPWVPVREGARHGPSLPPSR
jgi:hypothetical protein